MKTFTLLFVCVFSLGIAMAQPPEGVAKKGTVYGAETTAKGAISVNDLSTKVKSENATPVKVKGKVVDVCTKQGCWIKMETAAGKMMVKMKDHSFFVPLDLNGKEIVVDGTAKVVVTPVKELQHYAEDAGKSKDEIAKIKDPKREIVIDAKGVLVL